MQQQPEYEGVDGRMKIFRQQAQLFGIRLNKFESGSIILKSAQLIKIRRNKLKSGSININIVIFR
jgi:hypothetical protein